MPLFGTDIRLMIQIFCSNLAIVDLIKGLWNDQKFKIMSHFFIGGRGSDFKPKCSIFLGPKVPREGGCQARMGQCPIFLFFFFF